MNENLFNEVRKVLAKQLRKPEDIIKPESKIIDDLGADSLNILMLLMTIEEDFGIKVPDEELAVFKTVGDVVSFLEKQSN
ncbi:MAG: acyl carrier protein [Spirochaetales bacterium]|nr:acyl carrier protein [Spirochaetales bacterium]MBO4716562.1 acyl carrier protein [Spirochaetales bacterium]MBR4427114.1 acyl carrier protein [Spirochaetales bacterium]